jgi:DNA-binding response OmpR family regulator
VIHHFGPFRYDTEQRLLFRDDEMVPLAPKAIDTLHVLLAHVCAFLRPSVRNPLKVQGRFSVFEKV